MFRYQPISQESDADFVARLCDRVEESLEKGLMPVEPFQDERVFRAEMERIFTKSWVFVAHESELKNAGDFVLRRIGLDQVIVTRTKDRAVHVLLNHCRHRGAPVCAEESGNSTRFRCPYHGWIYKNDGDFLGAPLASEAYGTKPDSKEWGLLKAPKIEILHGLIFANLDQNAPTLREYLGGAAWMLDAIFDIQKEGFDVLAPPERFIIRADWKSGAENFSGDSYHVQTAHYSATLSKFTPFDLRQNGDAAHGFLFDNGHSFIGHAFEGFAYWGLIPEIREKLDLSRLDSTQLRMLETDPPTIGTIFPNFSYLRFPTPSEPGRPNIPYTDIRLWQPLEPGVMEMWRWQLEFACASDEYRKESYEAAQFGFGSGGMIEIDDTILWEGVAGYARSPWARRDKARLHYGQKRIESDPGWCGPGKHYNTTYGEYMQDGFWRRWIADIRNCKSAEDGQ